MHKSCTTQTHTEHTSDTLPHPGQSSGRRSIAEMRPRPLRAHELMPKRSFWERGAATLLCVRPISCESIASVSTVRARATRLASSGCGKGWRGQPHRFEHGQGPLQAHSLRPTCADKGGHEHWSAATGCATRAAHACSPVELCSCVRVRSAHHTCTNEADVEHLTTQ